MYPSHLIMLRASSILAIAKRSKSFSPMYPGAHKVSGAFRDRPQFMAFGILRSLLVGVPCIYIGAMISREGAALLEDWDIFVPDND